MDRQPADLPAGAVSYQIVCLSCGYHRAWPTLVDALADGHRHHAEHTAPRATPALPATPQPQQDPGGDGSTQRS